MTSVDILSMTNPALNSLLLRNFVKGYNTNLKSCPFLLLFLPLPFVLSESIRETFKGTNSATGLYTWLTRNQNLLINLNNRIEMSSSITRNAIIFGCYNQLLVINEDGTLNAINKGITISKLKNSSVEVIEMLDTSKRLGCWFSQIESTTNIFNSLGLTL